MSETKSISYIEFAQQLYDTGIISDPWLEGKERFRIEPMILTQAKLDKLYISAERIGKVYEEFCEIIWSKPDLLESFFYLTPYEKLLWLASKGEWHGIARMDLFIESNGDIKFCEMNSDTPSGEAEAVLLNKLCMPRYPYLIDPNKKFPDKFYSMVMQIFNASNDLNKKPTVGIIYPTEMPEDLSMISIYQSWFENQGSEVVLGSPFNIKRDKDGYITLFDKKIDIMFRHYKTDWWCERMPVWTDQDEYPDSEPLDLQIRYVLDAELNNKVSVINPFGAVLTQNKFSIAFIWQNRNMFSKESQESIISYFPETIRFCDVNPKSLSKEEWVLKSDYGCEGDEVIIGPFVSDNIWNESIEKAIPERWIFQRFFEAAPIEGNQIPNYGVYILGGEPAGIYIRLSQKATDYMAVTVPVLIGKENNLN